MLAGSASFVLAAAIAPDAIALEWRAPAECPTQDDVRARVDRLLASQHADVHARADVTPMTDGGWTLVLAIEAPEGLHTHTWRAERCDALADATALAIAVAADPVQLVRRIAIPDAPIASTPRPRVEPPRAVRTEQRAASPRVDAYARAQVVAGVLVLPDVDVGAAIAVGLQREGMRVELVGGVLGPRAQKLRESPASVRMLAGTIDARGCWMAGRRVALGMCGLVEVAIVRGVAFDVPRQIPRHDTWVGLGFGPLLQIPIARRWQIHLGADALVAARRPRFAIVGLPNDVAKTGAAGVRGFVGVAIGSWRRAP